MNKNCYIYNKVKSMVGKTMLFLALGLLSLNLLGACDAEDSISRKYPCQFIFKTSFHPGSTIETALNGAGTYTFISAERKNGIWHIYSTLNDGRNKTEDIALSTASENYANYSYMGAGTNKDVTKNGFILGQTNFNGLTAWERQCPNCIMQYGGTSYPLEWTGNRQSVTCGKCQRVYSLENGTITSGDRGDILMRYRVTYSGIGSVLTVGN